MPDTVINVENLSKLYSIGEVHKQTNSFRDKISKHFTRLAQSFNRKVNPAMLHAPCSMQSSNDDSFWALNDISFKIKQGEVLGIIGANGAGKSTLLKILARVTKPTKGRAVIEGKMSSLLEVGIGFHPELTGRENVYLNGSILGMRKAEVARKFDDIIAFAEIEKFVDTPVKRFSSGMYVRLAFAVAAHLDPDILVIDEVLAVGDIEYQAKCLQKMEGFSQKGVTVVIVSHNLTMMQSLCPQTMVLDHGQIQYLGPTKDAVVYYQKYMAKHLMEMTYKDQRKEAHKKRKAEILHIDLLNENRKPAMRFTTGGIAFAVLTIQFYETLDNLRFAIIVKTADGSTVFDTDSVQLGVKSGQYFEGNRVKVEFMLKMNLLKGVYSISAHIKPIDFSCYYHFTETVTSFEVAESYSWQGVAHLEPQVRILEGNDSTG